MEMKPHKQLIVYQIICWCDFSKQTVLCCSMLGTFYCDQRKTPGPPSVQGTWLFPTPQASREKMYNDQIIIAIVHWWFSISARQVTSSSQHHFVECTPCTEGCAPAIWAFIPGSVWWLKSICAHLLSEGMKSI